MKFDPELTAEDIDEMEAVHHEFWMNQRDLARCYEQLVEPWETYDEDDEYDSEDEEYNSDEEFDSDEHMQDGVDGNTLDHGS